YNELGGPAGSLATTVQDAKGRIARRDRKHVGGPLRPSGFLDADRKWPSGRRGFIDTQKDHARSRTLRIVVGVEPNHELTLRTRLLWSSLQRTALREPRVDVDLPANAGVFPNASGVQCVRFLNRRLDRGVKDHCRHFAVVRRK